MTDAPEPTNSAELLTKTAEPATVVDLVERRAALARIDEGFAEATPEERPTPEQVVKATEVLKLTPEQAAAYAAVTGAQRETHPKFWTHPARAEVRIVDAAHGVVEVVPKRKRVAIVGFADSSRDHAPFDDPSWEIWGLNQLYRMLPRFDRWFEIHSRAVYEADIVRDTNYVEWLRTSPVPVYMWWIGRDEAIANAVRYPIEAVGKMTGLSDGQMARWLASFGDKGMNAGGAVRGPYLQSAPAWMLALAILEGFEEISLWGIDLIVGQEYEYQKCNMEHWIGIAMASGITVTIPETSALLRQSHVYGPEIEPPFHPFKISDYLARIAQLHERRNVVLTSLNQIDGAIHELDNVAKSIAGAGDAAAGCPLTPADFQGRMDKLMETRNVYLTEMNALDGAISENEGWRDMATLIQRGATVTPSWKKVI